MMNRLFPYPAISFALMAAWLLLNQSLSAGQLILSAIFGVTSPWVLTRLDAPPLRVRRPLTILRVLWTFAKDVVSSNLHVAKLILVSPHPPPSGFVRIQLEMRSPYGLTALAIIVTGAPGTAWINYDPVDGMLVLHILDLMAEDDWAASIKTRYEKPLMEIFE